MMEDMEMKVYRSTTDYSSTYAMKIPDTVLQSESFSLAVLKKIAETVAEKFVEEHYAEIAAKLDQNAIANLAIAEASKKIAEEIQRRPNIVREVEHHTAVYQRGLLGGLRRVG